VGEAQNTALPADAMARLMRPRSVAILGASSDFSKFSGRPLAYLREMGFEGQVFPIHPDADEIAGFRCYRTIEEVPQAIDAVVIARPAAEVPSAIERCIALGIRAFVVFSGGFAEAGPEGAALQQRMTELCRRAGAVLCGPNGTGIADLSSGAALSFMSHLDREPRGQGSVALISGSGSIAAMLFQGRGGALRSVASIGNEAVTSAAEFIIDAIDQAEVAGVAVFLESIRDPSRMVQALSHAAAIGKPVAILKGGRGARSAQVAATHTGALADDDVLLQAVFERFNVMRADSIEELKALITLMHAATRRRLGRGVGVLTPSGGTAVLITDELDRHGLDLPGLQAETSHRLAELIPQSSPSNPMDLTGFGANSQTIFRSAVGVMLDDPDIDVLIVPMGGAVGANGASRAAALIEAGSATDKLLVPIWQGTTQDQPGYQALLQSELPVMTDYALAVSVIGKLVWQRRLVGPRAPSPGLIASSGRSDFGLEQLESILRNRSGGMSEPEVKSIFRRVGISVPEAVVLKVKDGRAIGRPPASVFPGVLKVVSADITHKSAVGGVAFVQQESDFEATSIHMLGDVTRQAPQARIEGLLVEEMIPQGLDLLVGLRSDPHYGILLTLAHGGIWANDLRGAVSALLPLDLKDIEGLLGRFFKRSTGLALVAPLADFIARLAGVAQALGERLDVLEVNPVRLIGSGTAYRAVALDGVICLRDLPACPSSAQDGASAP
jgi:acyl-CoA synthetase (NDP forming)